MGLLTDDIPGLITTIVQFIGAFCFLCTMDSRLAWVIVGILPLTLIISKLYMKRLRSLTHQVRAEESKVQSAIQEAVQHSLVIKTLDSLDYVVGRLANTQQHLHSKVIEKTKYSSFSATFVNLGFAAGYLVTFAWAFLNCSAMPSPMVSCWRLFNLSGKFKARFVRSPVMCPPLSMRPQRVSD